MPFPRREAQTRIKHDILRDYAGAWAGIIANGTARRTSEGAQLDLAYFDAFAGYGRFDGDADKPFSSETVWGSPIIGLRALQSIATNPPAGLRIRVTGIIVEENSAKCDELLVNLSQAGLDQPIRPVSDLRRIERGAISVVQDDVRCHVEDFLAALGDDVFLLAFTDPFGPLMPMSLLKQLVARQRTDGVTLFPVYRIHEYAGSALKRRELRTTMDDENIRRVTAHMGNDRWIEVARRGLHCTEAAPLYVELFREELKSAAVGMVAKDIGLSFSGRTPESDYPGYHLFLTTRNPDGAFRMNRILRNAEVRRHWDHWSDHEQREIVRRHTSGEYELDLGVPHTQTPTVTEVERIPAEEVAADLVGSLLPATYTLRQILERFVDSIYTYEELKSGLKQLKKDGRARYETLKSSRCRVEILTTP